MQSDRRRKPNVLLSLAVLYAVLFTLRVDLPVYGLTGAVNGFARDASNGGALAYCNVYLDKTDYGAAANDKGYYYIGRVPAGKYDLVASFVGFKTARRQVVVADGQTVKADVELQPGSIEVGEVKVTAERARFEREVEVSAVRLDTRQLQFIPKVGGEADLFRTIQLLPGVVTTSDFSNRLYIRGGSPDQNLILLDGITVYNPSHLFGMFSPFIAEAVSDVTLLAGGFPAKYGGRLSSVLDVTTKEGNFKRYTGDASVSMIAAQGQVEGPIGNKGSFLVAGRRTYLPDILLKAFGVDGLGYYFYDLMGKANYEPWQDSKFTLAGLSAADVLDFWDAENPQGLRGRLSWGNRGASLRWNRVFTPVLYGEVMGAWSDFRSDFKVNFGTPQDALINTDLTDLELKSDLTWYFADRHTLDLGLDAHVARQLVHFTYDTTQFERQDTLAPVALYADEKWEAMFRRLFVKPGLRLAFYSKGNRFEIEPRLGVKYLPAKNTAVNASVGRFTQPVVTLNSTDAVFSIYDVWVPVQPDQAMPTALHYIAGVEQWLRSDLMVSLEGYYKDYGDLLETRYGEMFTRPESLLKADGYSYGTDLMVRKTEGRVNGWASYSYMWTRRSIGDEEYHPHYDRRHNVNIVVTLPQLFWGTDMSLKWTLGTGLPYAGVIGYYPRYLVSRPPHWSSAWDPEWEFIEGARDAYRYPVYHRLDAGFTHSWKVKWGEISAFLDITNLYNAKNVLLYYWEVNEQGLPERHSIGMIPILPTIGVKARF